MSLSSASEDVGSEASWGTARLPVGNSLISAQFSEYCLTVKFFVICRLWLVQMNLRIVL